MEHAEPSIRPLPSPEEPAPSEVEEDANSIAQRVSAGSAMPQRPSAVGTAVAPHARIGRRWESEALAPDGPAGWSRPSGLRLRAFSFHAVILSEGGLPAVVSGPGNPSEGPWGFYPPKPSACCPTLVTPAFAVFGGRAGLQPRVKGRFTQGFSPGIRKSHGACRALNPLPPQSRRACPERSRGGRQLDSPARQLGLRSPPDRVPYARHKRMPRPCRGGRAGLQPRVKGGFTQGFSLGSGSRMEHAEPSIRPRPSPEEPAPSEVEGDANSIAQRVSAGSAMPQRPSAVGTAHQEIDNVQAAPIDS